MKKEKIKIPHPEGHHCFACGTANPIGLKLKFYLYGDALNADITLGKNHVGWEKLAHGGIISTILDEIMSWSVLYYKKSFFLTRKMEVKYIKPVMIETPLTVRSRLVDDHNPKRIKAKGELFNDKGNLLARSMGEFILLSKEELTSIPEGLKQEMFSIIEEMDLISKS